VLFRHDEAIRRGRRARSLEIVRIHGRALQVEHALLILPTEQDTPHRTRRQLGRQDDHFPSVPAIALAVEPAMEKEIERRVLNVAAQQHVLDALVRNVLFIERGLQQIKRVSE
jgi:hypothetical protein